MRGPATLLVSAITVGSLAAALSIVPAGEAAEECIAKPTSTAPRGSHWYYRLDRSNNRRCWFLAAEREKASARRPAPRPTLEPVRRSATDAETRPPERATGPAETATSPAETVLPPPLQWAGVGASGYAAPRPEASRIEEPVPVKVEEDMPLVWPPLAPQTPAQAAASPSSAAVPIELVLASLTGALALAAFIVSRIASSGRKPRLGRSLSLETGAAPPPVPRPKEIPAKRGPASATLREDAPVPAFLLRPPPWLHHASTQRPSGGEVGVAVRRSNRASIANAHDEDIERRLERLLQDWRRAAA